MVHYLTLGHLDKDAIRECAAVASSPLDDAVVRRVMAEFPGIRAEVRDGYLVLPWHGLGERATQRGVRSPAPRADGMPHRRPAERSAGRPEGIGEGGTGCELRS